MDQSSLVAFGRAFIQAMDAKGDPPRGALWVSDSDQGTWKLWIVPPTGLSDQRDFYRRSAEIMSDLRDGFPGFDIADIEFTQANRPVIQGMSKAFKITGGGPMNLTSTSFNGVYLPDSIVLHMDL